LKEESKMPTHIEKRGSKWCVIETKTGEKKGCSDTKRDAIAHKRIRDQERAKKT